MSATPSSADEFPAQLSLATPTGGRTSGRQSWRVALAVVLLAVASLSCSVGDLLFDRSAAVVPTATKTRWPTFTPVSAQGALAQAAEAQVRGVLPPGVTAAPPSATVVAVVGSTNLVIFATETPAATGTPDPTSAPAPTPTGTVDFETNRPTPLAGPRALPTPYVVVQADTLNTRRGPGTNYGVVDQVKRDAELFVLGKNDAGDWWQVCCVSNQPVWVSAQLVEARGPLDSVPVISAPPTATPRPPAPPTFDPGPQPTPLPPFDIASGPEFPIRRDNGVMTIWVKVYEGLIPYERPLPGYILVVKRDGVDVSSTEQSSGDASFSRTAPSEGERLYNLKYERHNAGEANWEIYLARPSGYRVSPVTQFTTMGDSYRNLVVYIAYWLAR